MKAAVIVALTLSLLAPFTHAEQAVNAGAALVQDFQKRVDDYMKLHKSAGSKLPIKSTVSQAQLTARRAAFAAAIRAARPQSVQGEIFTPPIVTEFRRLVALTMNGERKVRIQKSLKRAAPVQLQLKVNDSWPETVPLQSTPPTLLLSLPQLPPGLEYRVIDRDLVLRDADANLIVDFAVKVLPATASPKSAPAQ